MMSCFLTSKFGNQDWCPKVCCSGSFTDDDGTEEESKEDNDGINYN